MMVSLCLRDKSVHDVVDTEQGRTEVQSPEEVPGKNTSEGKGRLIAHPFRETNDQDWRWDQAQKQGHLPTSTSSEGGM
jgi:hypothetical protein